MQCFFINLDADEARRREVQRSFAESALAGWQLTRVPAVDGQSFAPGQYKGTTRPGEIACFLSHIRALELALDTPGHCLIAEDDVLFGRKTGDTIAAAMASAPEDSWDLLFTDVCVPAIEAMVQLFMGRRDLESSNRVVTVNLNQFAFAASTAYVINPKSKARVLRQLTAVQSFDLPYDLHLRKLIHEGSLRASVVFPFATSLSTLADTSQIQLNADAATEAVWNAFRRLVWNERSVAEVSVALDRVSAPFADPETLAFSKILACLLSPNFRSK